MTARTARALLAMALALALLAPPAAAGARHFSARVTNPWFPLAPGTRFVYAGAKDGTPVRDVVDVTHRTALIGGVRCVVVRDRLFLRGRLAERTRDFYAQDARGTVWYFGEDTAELDRHGDVTSTEGTWRSGRDGARAGVFMPARPRVGERHSQERFPGHAEDRFQVVSLDAAIAVPYGTFAHALRTREWTPLEPRVRDAKWYVRGLGEVAERTLRGGREQASLVAVEHGR